MNKAANVFNKMVKKLFPTEVKHIDYVKGTKLHLKGKEADNYIKTQRALASMNKKAEDENTRRLKRGAGAALGIAGTIGAATMIKKRLPYIRTKLRGDLDMQPFLKNMRDKGKKLKGKIKEEVIKAKDYVRAEAIARHAPKDDPKVMKALSDNGIIALASLTRRSAGKN